MKHDTFTSSNPIAALSRLANEQPRETAFWFDGQAWTYEQFFSESLAVARGLKRLGIKPGDIIAVHMSNRPEMLQVMAACMQLGIIVAPLRTAFKETELQPLLKRLQPALYIGEAGLYPNVAGTDPFLLPFEKRYVVGNVADGRVGHWSELTDRSDRRQVLTLSDPDAPMVLICTSGTSGQPKLVCHTQGTLSAIVKVAASHIRTDTKRDDIALGHLPLAHIGGVFTFLTYLKNAAPFVLMTFDPDGTLDAIERYHCTILINFPSQYAAMAQRQQSRPRDLKSLALCLVAGDVCPSDLQRQVSSVLGCDVFNMWGATEAIGPLVFASKPGAVCRTSEGAEIRLIGSDGQEVAHGEIGEFCVRGPYVFAGYWMQPEETAAAIKDGWYHSGDLMRRGDGDELWFAGRRRDIIIRGATNISPVEIEEALVAAHPAVVEAAVVGVEDAVLGQRVVGFVRLAGDTPTCNVEDIRAAVNARLADYKVPEWLAVLQEFPLNQLGKIDRKILAGIAQWRDEEERRKVPSMWATDAEVGSPSVLP